PFQQGKGLGSALMRHALARCDGEGKAAFLESSNPKNVSLYERHGFEVVGRIQGTVLMLMSCCPAITDHF
ncbi:MAG: GNAT family N-acetyltransferase, partial [Candidatus Binatia bacterium]